MQTAINQTTYTEETVHPQTLGTIEIGKMRGQLVVPADFDDPLPDDLLDLFEGKGKPAYPDANF